MKKYLKIAALVALPVFIWVWVNIDGEWIRIWID